MGNLSFNEETTIQSRRNISKKESGLNKKLISWGIVKNEQQANKLILGIVAIAIGITIFNILSLISTPVSSLEVPLD